MYVQVSTCEISVFCYGIRIWLQVILYNYMHTEEAYELLHNMNPGACINITGFKLVTHHYHRKVYEYRGNIYGVISGFLCYYCLPSPYIDIC